MYHAVAFTVVLFWNVVILCLVTFGCVSAAKDTLQLDRVVTNSEPQDNNYIPGVNIYNFTVNEGDLIRSSCSTETDPQLWTKYHGWHGMLIW